jgi:hypothetical protein
MRASQVIRLLEHTARTSPLASRARRAASTRQILQCGLVLQKVDGRAFASLPESDVLWCDRDALSKDVADVMFAMSDPGATDWGALMDQIHTLASMTTAYFANIEPNPARDEFLAEWKIVRALSD